MVAGLPDLFTWEHTSMSDEESWSLVKDVVERSCDSMNLMKDREGAALAVELSVRAIPLKRSGVAGLCWLIRPSR
mgnify:CR=1 FL=1